MSRTYLLTRAKALAMLANAFTGVDGDWQAFYAARAELAAWHATRAS
jgi:hypothetical protein